jgi:UDP:flavonoid glycosyltransferase YjiC (YdhE family)
VVIQAGFPVIPAGIDPYAHWAWGQRVTAAKARDLLSLAGDGARPDLILREITDFGSIVAAEAMRVPHVTIGGGLYVTRKWWCQLLQGSVDRVRQFYGLPPDPYCQRLYPHAYCDATPRWFQKLPDKPIPTHRYYRVATNKKLAVAVSPHLVRGQRPLIYATLGTVYNQQPQLFRNIVRAFYGAPIDVLCTLGVDQNPADLFPDGTPPNVRVERYVPQHHILPRCAAVITHGGFSTLLGVLRHSAPPLVIPLGSDQPLNAERCVELGIGLALEPARARPDTVSHHIELLLNRPRFRRELGRLQSSERDVPLVGEAVRLFEEVAARDSRAGLGRRSTASGV